MSLYRQAGRVSSRTLALVAAAALATGGGIGYALGSGGGDDEVSVAEAVAALRSDVRPIRNALDFVPTEYGEGVEGERVISEPEYGAARAAVARARETLGAHRADLRALSAQRSAELEDALAELASAVDGRRREAEVERLTRRAASALQALVG